MNLSLTRWTFLLVTLALYWPSPNHQVLARDIPHQTPASELFVAGLRFVIPASWEAVPPATPIRLAQWRVEIQNAEHKGELVLYSVPQSLLVTTEAILQEWQSLLSPAAYTAPKCEISSRILPSLLVTEVYLRGTYLDEEVPPGVPPRIRTNWGLLGAVVENAQTRVALRCTGPLHFTENFRHEFEHWLDSIRPAVDQSPSPSRSVPLRALGLRP